MATNEESNGSYFKQCCYQVVLFRLQQRHCRTQSNMDPKFWLSVAFLMSRIGIFEAAGQCHQGESSIWQKYLRGHTFKTYKVGCPAECFLKCDEELTCQSYNFHIGQKVCELNNRTKEARPEDFMPGSDKVLHETVTQQRYTFFSLFVYLFQRDNAAIFKATAWLPVQVFYGLLSNCALSLCYKFR